ncbi:MAG: hypothetical protein B7Y12_24790 [Rhizobiales bacterium 24-66-13]|jgi:hypothetical protein|nr:MAG: hypothetical protein B7Z45_03430 [Azorhizobium sp. 12-66-6]OYY80702.1 MAG: hypothetical protein B7Y61_15260 [Rhizobiales bacterium 35-66-30]OYZ64057.1 MAG: hypothetical protein B7Y12_24790 [Rhizobiales bacterium 24-66-13]OZB09083.1 MAG: hypothetical protein B7X67_07410 [Rhizobiales bacterium 39-66-18]HQS10287.1 DUF4239 domain-containing protein [Xanthobacteraceae bacterium]
MDALTLGLIVFAALFGGAAIAIRVAPLLPAHHLSKDSQDAVKLGVGMIAAMASLVLGLMTASVSGNFGNASKDVNSYALNLLSLDTDMRHFQPQSCPAQVLLADYIRSVLHETWTGATDLPEQRNSAGSGQILLQLDGMIHGWTPATADDAAVRTNVQNGLRTVLTSRWTVSQDSAAAIPIAFVIVLVAWLALIFVSFGLYSPPNMVVIGSLLLCAASIAGALFLISEMSGPFDGLVSISPQPMVRVLDFIDTQGCGK